MIKHTKQDKKMFTFAKQKWQTFGKFQDDDILV